MPSLRFLFLLMICPLVVHAQTLVNAFPNLTFAFPIFATHSGDCTNRLFVIEQDGIIKVFPNDSAVTSGQSTNFLNITSKTNFSGSLGDERGLLGLAFHPDYENNGYFYVYYTASSPSRTVVSRYSVMPGNPNKADSLSELILLQVFQEFSNHNGGMLLFGNDGYLYIGKGDGGSSNDPDNRSQNLDSLCGKILRIDIDTTAGYRIPPTNPLVGIAGRDEIFAWGMRNPWRGSSDPVTGQLWWGDVGQGAWEEIDLIENGKNYGWKIMEGAHCRPPTVGCVTTGLTFPVKEYSHSFGCSITGGYVYRGYRRPELYGYFLYSDYCSGTIWKFHYDGGPISGDSVVVESGLNVSSFGVDELGEVYVCDIGTTGRIYRFAGALPPPVMTSLNGPADGSLELSIPVTLSWACVVGATKYRIEVDDDSTFGSPAITDSTTSSTSYLASSLAQGIHYYWRVRTMNIGGWGSYTPAWDFTTETPFPPAAPALVSPPDSAVNQPTSPTLSWSASVSATGYELQVSTDSLFGSLFLDDSTLTGTSRVVSGLDTSTLYHWRVIARNIAGSSPWSDVWKFTTYVPAPPVAPVLLSPPDAAQDQPTSPTLRWATASGADSYEVQVSTDSLFGSIILDDSLLADTSRQAPGLDPGTMYYWRVNARNTVGTGPWSDTWDFTATTMVTRQYAVTPGWNLISVPLSVTDASRNALYPDAISSAFRFSTATGYVSEDTLLNGIGYWLKFGGSDSLNISGDVIVNDTVPVFPGWNIIGPISDPIDTADVVQIPPGILSSEFFGYSIGYFVADTLHPSEGYWVKASATGVIIFPTAPRPASRGLRSSGQEVAVPWNGETKQKESRD